MPVVYADVLFLINFIMDYIVILTAAAALRIKVSLLRGLSGAAFGAVYAVGIFFTDAGIYTCAAAKLTVSALIVSVAYNPGSVKLFIRYLLSFYIINILFGGGIFAALFFTGLGSRFGSAVKNGVMYFNIPVVFPLLTAAALSAVSALLLRSFGHAHGRQFYDILIGLGGRTVKVRALVDTGNSLFEKTTGLPVIIVESGYTDKVVNIENERVYIIPFSTVGRSDGVILGFKPDFITVYGENKCIGSVIVGIYNGILSGENEYSALINPAAL